MDTRQGHHIRAAVPLRGSIPRLFWVTDDSVLQQPGFLQKAETALRVGGSLCALQLRSLAAGGSRMWDLAARLQERIRRSGASLWINDRLDVAMSVRADGVQLGRRGIATGVARRLLGATCPIGRSVHSRSEVARAFREGADIVVLGSIYPTSSHPGRAPLGLDPLRDGTASGPVIAIGGITPDRVSPVMRAGAVGVAVRSGIWEAPSVSMAAARYVRAIATAGRGSGGATPEDESLGLDGIDGNAE